MRMYMILMSCLLINKTIFTQIDTLKIKKEIEKLVNDSLINDYWNKLDSIDQNLFTLSDPITQTENLVKSLYFFKYFGFSEYNRFNKSSISFSDAEMRAKIIWMHSSFSDLNIYSFPLIIECFKIDKNFDYPNYFLQNIQLVRIIDNIQFDDIIISKLEEANFEKIDLKKVVELSNEFIQLQSEIDKIKIIYSWKTKITDNSTKSTVEYEYKIIKHGKLYYLESMGNYFKLIKSKKNKNIFFFVNEIANTYLEISQNGDLYIKEKC